MNPKKYMRSIATLLMATALFGASAAPVSVTVKDVKVERSESSLVVSMDLDASALKVKSDREIKYLPVITDGTRRAELPVVVFAGRNRFIQNERHGSVTAPDILSRPGRTVGYSAVVPFEQWMESSRLTLVEDECDCGFSTGTGVESDLATLDFVERVFAPQFVMVTPPRRNREDPLRKGIGLRRLSRQPDRHLTDLPPQPRGACQDPQDYRRRGLRLRLAHNLGQNHRFRLTRRQLRA